MKNKTRKMPLLVLSASAMLAPLGYSTWINGELVSKDEDITTNPSTPVCYIESAPSIKYTTIEKALEVANTSASSTNKQTVVVIPHVSSDYVTPWYVISKPCTIGENVTLSITYDESVLDCETDKKQLATTSGVSYFADSEKYYKTNLKSNVGLNTTLTVKGSLNICGKVGSSAQRPSGQTSSYYAQLSLFDDATISCEGSGKISCLGYVKEWYSNLSTHEKRTLSQSNGSRIVMSNSSSLAMPGVIYDFYGGTFSLAASSTANSFPFTSFDFPNIQSTIELNYGSSVIAYSQVYATKSANCFEMKVIGPDTNFLFVVSQDSKLLFKYNSISSKFACLYGTDVSGSQWNTMSMIVNRGSVDVNAITVNGISSEKYFLPINYKYNIEVNNGATLNFSNPVKFLKGSRLVVNQGGTINFNNKVLFHQLYNLIGGEHYISDTATSVNTTSSTYPFPSDDNIKKMYSCDDAAALLLNNGTINVSNEFGGFVSAGSDGATVTFLEGYSDHSSDNSIVFGIKNHKYLSYQNVTGYSNGMIGDASSRSLFKLGSYVAKGGYWTGTAGDSIIESSYEVLGELKHDTDTSCILPTALVLMADGTYREAGTITTGDMVIAFNHETGKFEATRVLFNDHQNVPAKMYDVLHLEFDNGKSTDLIYEHGYFDLDENKYVYIRLDNYQDYIGHRFVFVDNMLNRSEAKLIKASIVRTFTRLASIGTANHINAVVDDMLSMAGALSGLFNIFEYDPSTLAFDADKMKRDIDKYGLLDYEYFKDYFPKEIYDLLPCKYLGVSIGKGLITWDIIKSYISKWKDQLMENMK